MEVTSSVRSRRSIVGVVNMLRKKAPVLGPPWGGDEVSYPPGIVLIPGSTNRNAIGARARKVTPTATKGSRNPPRWYSTAPTFE